MAFCMCLSEVLFVTKFLDKHKNLTDYDICNERQKELHRGTVVHVLSSRSFVIHAPKMVMGLQAVAGGIAE
jgi:hypothetical protein